MAVRFEDKNSRVAMHSKSHCIQKDYCYKVRISESCFVPAYYYLGYSVAQCLCSKFQHSCC